LRPKPGNPAPPWVWGSTKKPTTDFEAKPEETVTTGFESKLEKTVVTDFEAKPGGTVATTFEAEPEKTVATGFEAKPEKTVVTDFEAKPEKTVLVVLRRNNWQTVPVILMSNHWQTVDFGFDDQLRNPHSSSPRAWCRPHTMSLDFPIVRSLSTRPVRPSPVLCTKFCTPAMILIAAYHVALATYTLRDKQTRFFKWNKEKR
jgi:hypothetical protein